MQDRRLVSPRSASDVLIHTGFERRRLDSARPRDVLAAAGDVLARGRLDGFYERS